MDKVMIDADRPNLYIETTHAKRIQYFLAHGMACLGTQTQDISRSVVSLQRSEVDTRDGTQQPGCLPFFLDSAPCGYSCRTPLDRAAIHAHLAHPIHVEQHTRITSVRWGEKRLNDLNIYIL